MLATVTVLQPPELAHIVKHGEKGRAELIERFLASGEEHLSRVKRPSVVSQRSRRPAARSKRAPRSKKS
jgi:hypothetical protein